RNIVMAEASFLFIQEKGNGPMARAARHQIKSHVMDRIVSERRTAKQREHHDVDSLTQNDLVVGTTTHIWPQISQKSGSSSPVSAIAIQGMLDVYGSNIEMSTQTKSLFHYFVYRSMQLCSVSFETGWLQHAFNDAALFYSTLYHWTLLNYDYLPGQLRSPYHLLQLKGSAIRNINSNLTSGEELIDDDIIASVACLASAN
ncbi:hypothetical protein DH86_00003207, partial [Scytalidium sp. 3C]